MNQIERPINGILPKKLYSELVAHYPQFGDTTGWMVIHADRITLDLPKDVTEAQIDAVINAHDPTPPPPVLTKRELAREKLAAIDATKITGETKKIIAVLADLLDD